MSYRENCPKDLSLEQYKEYCKTHKLCDARSNRHAKDLSDHIHTFSVPGTTKCRLHGGHRKYHSERLVSKYESASDHLKSEMMTRTVHSSVISDLEDMIKILKSKWGINDAGT
jgi:hypothetical protein